MPNRAEYITKYTLRGYEGTRQGLNIKKRSGYLVFCFQAKAKRNVFTRLNISPQIIYPLF